MSMRDNTTTGARFLHIQLGNMAHSYGVGMNLSSFGITQGE